MTDTTCNDPSLRQTGRTTRLLLRALLAASEKPNEWVAVRSENNTYLCHDDLARRCQEVAAFMNLNVDYKRDGYGASIRLIV